MFQNLHISKLFYIFVKTKEVITIKNKKSMSIFDYTTTRHFVIINGKKINYVCYHYQNAPCEQKDYYVMACPKSFQQALCSIFRYKYGVDYSDNNHISFTNNDGAFEIANEIEKAKNVILKHISTPIYSISYNKDMKPTLVIICSQFDKKTPVYLVNHATKVVMPIHGYPFYGKEYAQKNGYTYKNIL